MTQSSALWQSRRQKKFLSVHFNSKCSPFYLSLQIAITGEHKAHRLPLKYHWDVLTLGKKPFHFKTAFCFVFNITVFDYYSTRLPQQEYF